MKYNELTEQQKKNLLIDQYEHKKKSFADIAKEVDTYANKLRRDAIKYRVKIRDKSEAQKNAILSGKIDHPTKGKLRSDKTKQKIGMSVMNSWDNLTAAELTKRKDKARENWEKLSDEEKQNMLHEANLAVRKTSKVGSKLEKFLLNKLLEDGYHVEFHKEQTLLNTKLQIDLFLPKLNIAIEVDGPSHFEPVWGEQSLSRNKNYDNKKTGIILGKGWVLIRIKQVKDFSKSRAIVMYDKLKESIQDISKVFPESDNRIINLGD
jgi:very-short-patch-repair endonuclease